MLGEITEVSRDGRTVLFVSHQMDLISRLCGEAILLSNGQIQVRGPVSDVIEQYRNLETE